MGWAVQRVPPLVDSRVRHHQVADPLIAHHTDPDKLGVFRAHILRVMLKCYLHRQMTPSTQNARKRTISQLPANIAKMYPWNVLQQFSILKMTTRMILQETLNTIMTTLLVVVPLSSTVTSLQPIPYITNPINLNITLATVTHAVPSLRTQYTCITRLMGLLITRRLPTWGPHG